MSLSKRCSSAIGSVLVTTTSEIRLFLSRSTAGPEKIAVRRGDDDVGGAVLEQRLGGLHDRAAGVDHVVDEDADAALDLTDDLVHLDLVGHVRVAALVDDRQRRAEPVGPALGDPHPAGVRRDDGDRRCGRPGLRDVLREQRQREEVVDRAVEEALDLRRCAGRRS